MTLAIGLVVVLVLLVVVAVATAKKDQFLPATGYRPSCDTTLVGGADRSACKGFTTGWMPSIDDGRDGDYLCAGAFGVPV